MKLDEVSEREFNALIVDNVIAIRKHIAEMVGIPWTFIGYSNLDHGKILPGYVRLTIDPKHGEPYEPEGLEHEMLIHVIPLAIKSAFKKIGDREVEVEDMGESWTANRYKYRWKVTPIR